MAPVGSTDFLGAIARVLALRELRGLWRGAALLVLFFTLSAAASTPEGELMLELPAALHVGDHVSLVLTLQLPADARGPILLTPQSLGAALEVVRGRLLRADAREPAASPLVFDLPAIAQRPGQAVLSVRALIIRCGARGCFEHVLEVRSNVRVLP